VPVITDLKLQFLVSCATELPCSINLEQLSLEQRQALESMSLHQQMIMFTDIANSLMGDGVPKKVK